MKNFILGVIVGLAISAGISSAKDEPSFEIIAGNPFEELKKCRDEQDALLEYAGKCLIECKEPFPFNPS